MFKRHIISFLVLFAPAMAKAADFIAADSAVGPYPYVTNLSISMFKAAIIRQAPKKNSYPYCLGTMGLMYMKKYRASGTSAWVDQIKTCISNYNGNVPTLEGCTFGTARTHQWQMPTADRSSGDAEMLAFDMALTNEGRHYATWIEVSKAAGSPVKVTTFLNYTTNNGLNWSTRTEIASWESGSGYAVPQLVNLATNDNGEVGALVYLDRSPGAQNQKVMGQATTDQLVLLVFGPSPYNVPVRTIPVLDMNNTPDLPLSFGDKVFELVGGSGNSFHVLYAQGREYKMFTSVGYLTNLRDVPINGENATGLFPRATRTIKGLAILTRTTLVDMPEDPTQTPNIRMMNPDIFTIAGNTFTNQLVVESILPQQSRDMDILTIAENGPLTGPYRKINDPITDPPDRCLPENPEGSRIQHCYQWRDLESASGSWIQGNLQVPIVAQHGALVGNTYFYPGILVKRRVEVPPNGDFFDWNESVRVASKTFNFPVKCNKPPEEGPHPMEMPVDNGS